tara:strand:- start:250 stop:468 length:219 start_codon:yes stop_codon:yes gene_type:complete
MDIKKLSNFQLSFMHESMLGLYEDGKFTDDEMDKEVQGLFKDIEAELKSRGVDYLKLREEWVREEKGKWYFK